MNIAGCIATVFTDNSKGSKIKLNQPEVVAETKKFPDLLRVNGAYIQRSHTIKTELEINTE